jgi:hypothetical protein
LKKTFVEPKAHANGQPPHPPPPPLIPPTMNFLKKVFGVDKTHSHSTNFLVAWFLTHGKINNGIALNLMIFLTKKTFEKHLKLSMMKLKNPPIPNSTCPLQRNKQILPPHPMFFQNKSKQRTW